METPPSNIQAKNTGYNQNYRLETPINNDTDEYVKNEYLSKINPKNLKVQSPNTEKETFQKKFNELRKQLKYVDDTNWMFENNEGINPFENLQNLI